MPPQAGSGPHKKSPAGRTRGRARFRCVDRADGSDPEDAATQYLLGMRCTVVLFVLPGGIWSAIAGRILVDTLSSGGEALVRWRASQLERSE